MPRSAYPNGPAPRRRSAQILPEVFGEKIKQIQKRIPSASENKTRKESSRAGKSGPQTIRQGIADNFPLRRTKHLTKGEVMK
jgi:hypothetical protein